jgi:uncharacterized FAD-dependent dehydrogenase
MPKQVILKLKPEEAFDDEVLMQLIAKTLKIFRKTIAGYRFVKQSIDARSRQQIWINATLEVFINEVVQPLTLQSYKLQNVQNATKQVVIVGAGPAGLFAALQLLEQGIKPIILERGKNVKDRRRDLAQLNKYGILNEESNYCFGEGGAGTYSDGKLYTRSNKRGNIEKILHCFVQYGADESILYKAHPHIGTNKLPKIITNIREAIIAHGGEIHFNQKVNDIVVENDCIKAVKTSFGNSFSGNAYILATGHSANDVYELLYTKNVLLESKPFALGVRIEHQQNIIDACQYHTPINEQRKSYLPPASYSLVEQVNGRGVFSFCMCPGGIIAPAATKNKHLVVNGWSPSKRDNEHANSGMVVQVFLEDALAYFKQQNIKGYDALHPLALLHFQSLIEAKAFEVGGGNFVAPAQRVVDFCTNKTSNSLPTCSYHPGLHATNLEKVLPNFVHQTLQQGIKAFGARMKGYYTNDAVVVGVESRTSSPVRIPRDKEKYHHPQIKNLYPCAEGAGYAGGIVSAAMDGENVAKAIFL